MSISTRSRVSNVLTKIPASREGKNTRMSLRDRYDTTFALVGNSDRGLEAPNTEPYRNLRRTSARALRKAQTTPPRSCVPSDNSSKENGISFDSGGFANVWRDSNAVMNRGDTIAPRGGEFKETGLISFLNDCRDGARDDHDTKEVQVIVDMLDLVLDNGGLHQRNRRKCQKYLRKLCGTFGTLPTSFMLEPTFDQHETKPFAAGGFSYVYKATLNGNPVVVKTLKVTTSADPEKAHKLLVKEVVGWKWLRHENILPFIGVMSASPLFSIISERMENGNIMEFVKAHPEHNRLCLLIGAATGLGYLHEHDILHGDLKGANILIDSNYHARLADFGLSTVIDESTTGSNNNHYGMAGTLRWMAPEVMYPDKFGFTGEHRKQLPSRSTDIYALGMTILEVITGCPPFNTVSTGPAVMYKVIKGDRPSRPTSGFSDRLWGLLVSTWCAEYGSRPSKRPSTSIVLDRLNEDLHNWGKSIIPPAPVQNADSTGILSGWLEGRFFSWLN